MEGIAHESGRATVYRARRGDRTVAVKVRKSPWQGPLPEPWLGQPMVLEQLVDDQGCRVTIMEWLDGHRLIDELAERVALHEGRVRGIFAQIVPAMQQKHPALRTDQIFMVDDEVAFLLGRDAPFDDIELDAYAAPELVDAPTITLASNAYALAVILYELFSGHAPFASPRHAIAAACVPPQLRERRPDLDVEIERLIGRALRPDPSQRLLLQTQSSLGGAVVTRRKRGYRPHDEREATLVEALRADPTDAATRQVYADWLEQHGFDLRADRMRLEDRIVPDNRDPGLVFEAEDPEGAPWRAIASRAHIDRCTGVSFSFACPRQWEQLTTTAFDDVRFCNACKKPVFFVTSTHEAFARGARKECIVIDSALVKREALAQYEAGAPRPEPPAHDHPMVMGMVAPPVPIPTAHPPKKASFWKRVFGRRT